MRSDDLNHIPHDIRGYLDEIAERLWSNHAAVMVGAGFSKNAEKGHESAKSFPTWNELADQFYEKLGGNKLDDGRHHYFNPLKLADEVQAAFGRSVLDQMLQTHIPDKEYEPSELHTSLLKLPWVDVFTVNYDTLLERAGDKITSRRFDVVMKSGELVYSTRPRIVKLHGSFPSTRPFIITEEDYRRYPTDHAPFVNTVQQSLLENTLVLLGFSGDDPNFLHWIGWVRDNLGRDTSPKIYLVGALSLTSAQRQLLNERNITAIDMAQCGNIDSDPHRKALTTFLDYLQTKKPVMNDDWPPIDSVFRVDAPIVEQVEGWRKLREAYPSWVVAPRDARNKLGRWPTGLDSETLNGVSPPMDLH